MRWWFIPPCLPCSSSLRMWAASAHSQQWWRENREGWVDETCHERLQVNREGMRPDELHKWCHYCHNTYPPYAIENNRECKLDSLYIRSC